MANYTAAPHDLFRALGDPTRCEIVAALRSGPASVTTLAAGFDMALPSFLKHIAVLERQQLVRSSKHGRVRTCELVPGGLAIAETWLMEQRQAWEARTDRMASLAERIALEEADEPR